MLELCFEDVLLDMSWADRHQHIYWVAVILFTGLSCTITIVDIILTKSESCHLGIGGRDKRLVNPYIAEYHHCYSYTRADVPMSVVLNDV